MGRVRILRISVKVALQIASNVVVLFISQALLTLMIFLP